MTVHYSLNAGEQHTKEALRGRFIQTLTEKSIAIQNLRGQGYYRNAKDDNGSKTMLNLKIKNIFRYYFIVLINVLVWYCC